MPKADRVVRACSFEEMSAKHTLAKILIFLIIFNLHSLLTYSYDRFKCILFLTV